jgi:hypothetical protein
MADLIEELRRRYEVVLLDAPPLLPVTDAAELAAGADGALLVCRYRNPHPRPATQMSEANRTALQQMIAAHVEHSAELARAHLGLTRPEGCTRSAGTNPGRHDHDRARGVVDELGGDRPRQQVA